MKTLTATAALAAVLGLAACQPAAEGTETADAGAAAAEGAAAEASASGGDMVEARLREGLWQTTITSAGMPTMTARMCMDEQMSAFDTGTANQVEVQDCDQTMTRTADGVDFTNRCEMAGGGVTETEGSITGDFQTAYRMEATITTTGTPQADGTVSMVTEAAYQGACPEGWRPGDMEVPGMGGMRINIHDAQDRARQAMPPAG